MLLVFCIVQQQVHSLALKTASRAGVHRHAEATQLPRPGLLFRPFAPFNCLLFTTLEMPITFGSVGDIISVALLIKDLVEALDASRGAQAEYRQLITDLKLLEAVLKRVHHLCNEQGSACSTSEAATLQSGLQIIESCRHCIQAFAERLEKYDSGLGKQVQRKSNVIKSAIAKIRWQVGEKEDVLRFRAEIGGQTASLNALLGATNWRV
jgi:hypothetical protein